MFTRIVSNYSREQLLPIIKGQLLEESEIYTDGWKAYDGLLLDGYKHYRIAHHKNEFALKSNHINGIESFCSYAKRRLGKFHGVGKHTFHLHLKECQWRFNLKNDDVYAILLKEFRGRQII